MDILFIYLDLSVLFALTQSQLRFGYLYLSHQVYFTAVLTIGYNFKKIIGCIIILAKLLNFRHYPLRKK